ncbi:DNA repair protein RecN [Gardnerella vaginalis 55152]|uniref:DNA repair protein RecN n=1 Tax=Gardnerella vaginalis 55152 TaxID=698955 RepID=I4LT94_GARVA|nr:DNA repair protein RecN [Gardnerella vaginalis]EIK80184.1 DNA repair protein RecN [Gardnerella vaginalis 55152]
MLEELEIRNLGPISHAVITPSYGMTAITGETGAGKSMLLSAIRLISGGKADSSRITSFASESWAQGVFSVPKSGIVSNLLQESGIDVEESESDDSKIDVYLSRTVPKSGRSRAVVSGCSVPKTLLDKICSQTITIHGQSDQLRIATSAKQREFLDSISCDSKELQEYSVAFKEWQDSVESYNRLINQESSSRQRADYLRESLEKIRQVDPKQNEDEELKAKRDRIENAAQIVRGLGEAISALDSSQIDYGAIDSVDALHLIDNASKALRSIKVSGNYEDFASSLEDISSQISDIVMQLAQQLDVDESQEDLDAINNRIHDLSDLTRRWGPQIDDVLEWAKKAQFELEDLDDSPEAIDRAKKACDKYYANAKNLADKLYDLRKSAAEKFSFEVSKELESLAMQDAQLLIKVNRREVDETGVVDLDSHGLDNVEFLFKPFPSSDYLPMGSSASGGELSRLMLAMELVAAKFNNSDSHSMTFIFDEVDSGVGGVAAVELGKRLAQLAKSSQVIVVTHLAQVASFADAQFVVRKSFSDSSVSGDSSNDFDSSLVVDTTVTKLDDSQREQEIARMLSGSQSQASLEHARELLKTSKI